jgi:hypothetical protein
MTAAMVHQPDCLPKHRYATVVDARCSNWCFGCGRCEPAREGDYRICGECMHVFRTPAELVSADVAVLQRVAEWNGFDEPAPRPVDEIAWCPVCAHDF